MSEEMMQQNTAKKQAEYAELLKKPQWQKRRLQMLEKADWRCVARQGRATDEAVRAALERLRATRHSAPDESRGRLNQ